MSIDPARLICAQHELPDPSAREFILGTGDWPLRGFIVHCAGQIRAYYNRCPHAGHPLNLRPHDFFIPDKTLLRCTSHGALFAVDSGLCVAGPCVGRSLQSLALEFVEGHILLRDHPDLLL